MSSVSSESCSPGEDKIFLDGKKLSSAFGGVINLMI